METKKGYVTMVRRPRPDHPNERQPVCIREDTIAMIGVCDFNYTPSDKAPVHLLPNAKVLKGEATFVTTITGAELIVMETPDEVLDLIEKARAGESKRTNYIPAGSEQKKVLGAA